MTTPITKDRLRSIHTALTSTNLTVNKKIEFATTEGWFSNLRARLSADFRVKLTNKHKDIEQIIMLINNTINTIKSTGESNYTNSTGNIVKSIYLINNHPLMLESALNIEIVTGSITNQKIDLEFQKYNNKPYSLKLEQVHIDLKKQLDEYASITVKSYWFSSIPSNIDPLSFFLTSQHDRHGYLPEENTKFDKVLADIKVGKRPH